MESMDNVYKRFEALERQTEPLQHQTRTGAPWWWWCLPWRVAALVVLGLALAHPDWVQAKTFRCRAGDVPCLIDAINAANANGQTNTIRLAAGTYTLTAVDNDTDGPNGLPSITSPLTLQGAGAASTILSRENLSPPLFRLVHVAPSGDLQVESLTLTGGFPLSAPGGGLWNAGTVRLHDCAISDNFTDAGLGGGIFNRGTLHVTHSTITGNSTSPPNGGSGGGIYNSGTVTLTHSTIADNRTEFGGGGIANVGYLTVTNSTIRDNFSARGGGIDNVFFHPPGTAGVVLLTNSTISGNTTLRNPKIDAAGVQTGGGGLANGATGVVFVLNSTITENTAGIGRGGGILGEGSVALANTMLARNRPAFTDGLDCAGAVVSLGSNLVGDPENCDIQLQARDLTGDPGLGPFTDNGRPGNGHFPLLPTSQAIDAGDDAACPRRDQLGQRRVNIPGVGTSRCDIGAIEFPGKDDRLHEEEDDQHDEDLAAAAQASQ